MVVDKAGIDEAVLARSLGPDAYRPRTFLSRAVIVLLTVIPAQAGIHWPPSGRHPRARRESLSFPGKPTPTRGRCEEPKATRLVPRHPVARHSAPGANPAAPHRSGAPKAAPWVHPLLRGGEAGPFSFTL